MQVSAVRGKLAQKLEKHVACGKYYIIVTILATPDATKEFEEPMLNMLDMMLSSWEHNHSCVATRIERQILVTSKKKSHSAFWNLGRLLENLGFQYETNTRFFEIWDWEKGLAICDVIVYRNRPSIQPSQLRLTMGQENSF